jgi:hypothetical protein
MNSATTSTSLSTVLALALATIERFVLLGFNCQGWVDPTMMERSPERCERH